MNWADQQDSERQAREERDWDALRVRLGTQPSAYSIPAPVNWDDHAPCRGCGEPAEDGALYCRHCQNKGQPVVAFQPGAAQDGEALIGAAWLGLVVVCVAVSLAVFGAAWADMLWLAPFGGR